MFEYWEDASGLQALGNGFGDSRNLAGIATIGAITDHRVSAFQGHVGEREAIHIDTKRFEVGRDQMAAENRGSDARGPLAVVEVPVARSRGISRPRRRTKPLYPTTFLIYQNGRVPPDDVTK
jgi:hypothetical protein